MQITLISHASVLIATKDRCIWTDPWLFGKAFNDSWALWPPAAWDETLLNGIDYLWISHEHPDHFHVPTLKSLPASFKERVTVLFMENNSDKMFRAFEALGFPKHLRLPHRKTVPLTGETSVYCYQEGQMNSCLAVHSDGETVLNVNDAEIRSRDCFTIRKDVGRCDVVLNQFSLAGYSGNPDSGTVLPRMADRILENVSGNHADLGAKVTIPFASFIYFCCDDNRYVNAYANTPRCVAEFLGTRGQTTVTLFPGDRYRVGEPSDSRIALDRFDEAAAELARLPYDKPKPVPLAAIQSAFHELVKTLRDRFTGRILTLLRPVTVRIPNLGISARLDLGSTRFETVELSEDAVDLVVNSQPLHFALRYPYGVQTLGVSARYRLQRGRRNWQLHRILFAMNNAEFYLRPRLLFTKRNAGYVRRRFLGGGRQILRRVQTMLD